MEVETARLWMNYQNFIRGTKNPLTNKVKTGIISLV
jgi:hypothetical protein